MTINDSIIYHIKTCFSCALHHNKNNVAGIIEGIGAIVPHTFGDHTKYGRWCKHSKDPKGEKVVRWKIKEISQQLVAAFYSE